MNFQKTTIREITDPAEFTRSARIIRTAFGTVANEFGITRENAPSNSAFITARRLRDGQTDNTRFFGLFQNEKQIGFIEYEKAKADFDRRMNLEITPDTYWLEKLAVLPEYRHLGGGEMLVGFAIDCIRQQGGKKVILGMMDQNRVLQEWYRKLDFRVIAVRTYSHLPFTVAFMARDL